MHMTLKLGADEMDRLTFIVTVIRAVIWPIVVVVIALVLRDQLRQLAERLTSVSLPGVAADFGQKLDQAREDGEKAKLDIRDLRNVEASTPNIAPKEANPLYELAFQHPEAAITEAFKGIERTLIETKSKLHPERKVNNFSTYSSRVDYDRTVSGHDV